MTAGGGHKGDLPPLQFAALAAELLKNAETLVPRWLAGGRKIGPEWVCGSLAGGEGRSCSVNLHSGAWADFSSDEKGGDLLSLYAKIHDLSMAKACLELARDEGLEDVAGVVKAPGGSAPPRPPRPAPPPKAATLPPRETWHAVVPVPAFAPPVNYTHQHRAAADIVQVSEYRCEGALYGYVVRFRTSDGGKDDIARTWCESLERGGARWHWKQWEAPRPLYLPSATLPNGRTVVLVEGEIKAAVLQTLLDAHAPSVYCVAGWPGGCKAWQKADWSWLAGCTVIAWPDCDSKRVQATVAERKAVEAQWRDQHGMQELAPEALRTDPRWQDTLHKLKESKPYLPKREQPGMKAMLGIGAHLRDVHGCTVSVLPIEAPGVLPDGWDARDAIEVDGWTGERVLAFFGQAQALLVEVASGPDPAPDALGKKKKSEASVGTEEPDTTDGDGGDDAFQRHLHFVAAALDKEIYQLPVDRKLLLAALRKAPLLAGRLCTDVMSDSPATLKPWPWRDKAGPLADVDHLRLGDWLSRVYTIKSASPEALQSAMLTVADEYHYHPIREWLQAQQWDGRPRLEKWLAHVLRIKQENVSPRHWRYLALMGKYMLLGLTARVMDPGCKFDYSPVFEGRTGRGKSTLIETLVGAEHFSDTHFDIGGGKDGMEQLRGIWAYELSEMTAFRRSDNEQVKQFFSSKVDRYRSSYGRFVQPHPRQCVIVCSTNKRRYLYDLSSQRRFWPVWVDEFIRVEWVKQWRGQIFAEALAAYRAGEQIFPSPEDEATYFLPEQRLRLVETTVHAKMYELLTREGAAAGEGKLSTEITQHLTFVTKQRMVEALGTDAGKSTVQIESQVAAWFEYYEWTYKRESTGARRYGYHRPAVWPPEVLDDEEDTRPAPDTLAPDNSNEGTEGGDDAPF